MDHIEANHSILHSNCLLETKGASGTIDKKIINGGEEDRPTPLSALQTESDASPHKLITKCPHRPNSFIPTMSPYESALTETHHQTKTINPTLFKSDSPKPCSCPNSTSHPENHKPSKLMHRYVLGWNLGSERGTGDGFVGLKMERRAMETERRQSVFVRGERVFSRAIVKGYFRLNQKLGRNGIAILLPLSAPRAMEIPLHKRNDGFRSKSHSDTSV